MIDPQLVDFDSARSTAPRGSLNRDDALVVDLVDLREVEVLHLQAHVGVMDISPPLEKAVMTLVGTGDRGLCPVPDLDAGVAEVRGGITGTEPDEPSAHDLGGFLRHRPCSISRRVLSS